MSAFQLIQPAVRITSRMALLSRSQLHAAYGRDTAAEDDRCNDSPAPEYRAALERAALRDKPPSLVTAFVRAAALAKV